MVRIVAIARCTRYWKHVTTVRHMVISTIAGAPKVVAKVTEI